MRAIRERVRRERGREERDREERDSRKKSKVREKAKKRCETLYFSHVFWLWKLKK